ncbi:hypothetical protein D3C87_1882000 [compost metagenome]
MFTGPNASRDSAVMALSDGESSDMDGMMEATGSEWSSMGRFCHGPVFAPHGLRAGTALAQRCGALASSAAKEGDPANAGRAAEFIVKMAASAYPISASSYQKRS